MGTAVVITGNCGSTKPVLLNLLYVVIMSTSCCKT